VAPYSVQFADEDKEEWDTGKGLRVMAVAYVPDYSQAAFACVVGPDGNCTHYLRLPYLMRGNIHFEKRKGCKRYCSQLE
jgi:transcription elongation factor SPT6